MRGIGWLFGAALALGVAGPAGADCKLSKLLDLPVTMEGHAAVVPATINGQPVSFEIDSGAFFSTISPGTAAQLQLKRTAAPDGFYVTGVGGTATAPFLVTIKNFELGGARLNNTQFLVLGNEFGHAGLLGQNLFARYDMEYDLAHGAIRFFHDTDCAKKTIAYWAQDVPFSVVKIKPVTEADYHTVGDLTLDGATVTATFDTGASTSILSLKAAARAGVKPNSPGVEDGGYTFGMGSKRVRTWIGRFRSIKIGDTEEIKNIHIRFGDIDDDGEATMLLGADFFLSHRVMVDNTSHQLFLTYNGGAVFDLSTDDGDSHQPKVGDALAGPEPTDAGGYSRRGAGYLARRDVPRATADFRQAIASAPDQPAYHRQLATALLAADKHDEAMAELDKAVAGKPVDPDSLLMRGELRAEHDRTGGEADADAFAAAVPSQANDRLELGSLYERLHAPGKAVRAFSDWIDAHPRDIAMTEALNNRCWVRALADIDLDRALDDCNRSVKLSSKAGYVVDSRALVWFRKGDLARARADYDMAIAANPAAANSLFMRGVVESRAGDKAAAEKDFAAVKALHADSADYFAAWGIKP